VTNADTRSSTANATESPSDPLAVIRQHGYVVILILAALIGIPVSLCAYGFLYLVNHGQEWIFSGLPKDIGFKSEPLWWPVPMLVIAGVIVSCVITKMPGGGGHSPLLGFTAKGKTSPSAIPGILIASLATLLLGAVLGPEAPLIALGGSLAVWFVHLVKRDAPSNAVAVLAAAGSFAAISTLLGSPIIGAFLMVEAIGLAGPTLSLVLVPGLLASGVGALVFLGIDSWTGLGTFSLTVPNVPYFARVNGVDFLYAIGIGLIGAFVGTAIHSCGEKLNRIVSRRLILFTAAVGLFVAFVAILYAQVTGNSSSEVLFSGQDAIPQLVLTGGTYSIGTLALLIACKCAGYSASLSSFRGGPIFPSIFIGVAAGILLSHLPGLDFVPAIAMGMGAMAMAMLKLPLTSVLLPTLLLGVDGITTMPVVIVAVVVAFVATARLTPLVVDVTA
jgi:H+/Cl- antiporter ClcA